MSPEAPKDQPKRHLKLVPPLEPDVHLTPRSDGGNPLLMTPMERQASYESRDPSEWDVTTPMPAARPMSEVIEDPAAKPSVVMSEEEFRAAGGTPSTVINHPDNPDTTSEQG